MIDEIQKAPREMREMLESVYNYNSQFIKNEEQDKLLERIILTMSIVDRKFFVSENYYLDIALPIEEEQTISQPSTVARMLMLAELKKGDSVLEIGAGSGWNAFLIAFLVYPGKVHSIDIFQKLIDKARENFSKATKALEKKRIMLNVNFSLNSIFEYSERKFDKIIITAGIVNETQEKLIEKIALKFLKNKGILVCPRTLGKIIIFKKNKKLEREETKEEYVFVPLLSEKEAKHI